MSRSCAIHQPHYLPWLRYFDKIARCDLFIVLDDAQYNKNGWQNRNRLKGPRGAYLATVPVKHRFACPLSEVEVSGDGWRRRHLASLRASYGRAPGFDRFFPEVERLLRRDWRRLVDLNLAMLPLWLELLGITTPWRRSSELEHHGTASERLAALCLAVEASHYLTGAYALQAYLDPEPFLRAGIGLVEHVWSAPRYPQVHPEAGFVPDLGIPDLIAVEPTAAGSVLRAAGTVVPLTLQDAR